jgi:hypothetical protein
LQNTSENLIRVIVQEVIKELTKRNILPDPERKKKTEERDAQYVKTKVEKIDMSGYKTPILTENRIDRLHQLTGQIIVPGRTIITPKAKDKIKLKQIMIIRE